MAYIDEYLSKRRFEIICAPVSLEAIRDKVEAAFVASKLRIVKLQHGHDPIIVSKKGSKYYVKVTSRVIKKISHKQYMRILAYMRQSFVITGSVISSASGHSALSLDFEIKSVKIRREGKR